MMEDKMDKRVAEALTTYASLAGEHGVGTLGALGWSSKEAQETRFKVILEGLGDRKGSMLDVGCGVGDIINTPGFSQHVIDYTGIDLISGNIDKAKVRFGKMGNARFYQEDILDQPFPMSMDNEYDFVIASGLFAHYPIFNINKIIWIMWQATKSVMAFNLIIPRSLPSLRDLATLIEMVGIERFVVRRDYIQGDVTVFGYKEGWDE